MNLAYPTTLAVRAPNDLTVHWVAKTGAKHVAELGVYRGHTTLELARILPEDGSLDLFDFKDVVGAVGKTIRDIARCAVRTHGNSYKLRDSYCSSLARLLENNRDPIWDYVYIDGAHTWDVDGFAFLLVDRLLRPGGYVDFDDYGWTLERSHSVGRLPMTRECYTDEQMKTRQVAMVVKLLARPMGYIEVERNKVFRKP